MKLRIGRRLNVVVASLSEASVIYQRERDASGEGCSTFPRGRVGKHTISYNGRVWLGDVVVEEAARYERARPSWMDIDLAGKP